MGPGRGYDAGIAAGPAPAAAHDQEDAVPVLADLVGAIASGTIEVNGSGSPARARP